LGGVPDIRIFLAHADHDALMTWATDDGTGWIRNKIESKIPTYGKTARGASSPGKGMREKKERMM